MSSNITVQGLKVINSPQFHFRFDGCQDVHIENLFIKSPALSPNTDGIHIEKTNNVQIYNSLISNGDSIYSDQLISTSLLNLRNSAYDPSLYTGDDCVSIGAGCYNVDIRNITCGPSHGIRCVNLVRQNVNINSNAKYCDVMHIALDWCVNGIHFYCTVLEALETTILELVCPI